LVRGGICAGFRDIVRGRRLRLSGTNIHHDDDLNHHDLYDVDHDSRA
jgi:hypothetical protein